MFFNISFIHVRELFHEEQFMFLVLPNETLPNGNVPELELRGLGFGELGLGGGLEDLDRTDVSDSSNERFRCTD